MIWYTFQVSQDELVLRVTPAVTRLTAFRRLYILEEEYPRSYLGQQRDPEHR